MRTYLAGLFLLLASCENTNELPGSSVQASTEKKPDVVADDNAVMGGYFRFDRPIENLLISRGKKVGDEKADPPPLTGKHLGAANDLVEMSLQSQLTEAQKKQLRAAIVAEYEAGGERREGVLSSPLSWVGMEQLYRKARTAEEREDLIKTNKELFVKGLEASPDYLYKQVLQSIFDSTQTVVAEGPPVMTQQHFYAELEMVEFMLAVYLKRPFAFSAEDREAVGAALIKSYQELPQLKRDLFAKAERTPDVLWVILRFQWMSMTPEQRQAFRVSLINVFGYPAFKGDLNEGAKALELLPESILSSEMRKMVLPKLGQLLTMIVQMPSFEDEMVSYLIYEY